jgi:hypothetical protein
VSWPATLGWLSHNDRLVTVDVGWLKSVKADGLLSRANLYPEHLGAGRENLKRSLVTVPEWGAVGILVEKDKA